MPTFEGEMTTTARMEEIDSEEDLASSEIDDKEFNKISNKKP